MVVLVFLALLIGTALFGYLWGSRWAVLVIGVSASAVVALAFVVRDGSVSSEWGDFGPAFYLIAAALSAVSSACGAALSHGVRSNRS